MDSTILSRRNYSSLFVYSKLHTHKYIDVTNYFYEIETRDGILLPTCSLKNETAKNPPYILVDEVDRRNYYRYSNG